MTLGLVCDACDALSPIQAPTCTSCGQPLAPPVARLAAPIIEAAPTVVDATPLGGALTEVPTANFPPPAFRHCPTCRAQMPVSHKFCGSCGGRLDPPSSISTGTGKTQFFGAMQETGRAKLILIRGEGMDGLSYVLASAEHLIGRLEGEILFPDDPLLSPRHANFFYRADGDLMVRNEGSRNGVFLRIKAPVDVEANQPFLVGEQLLSVAPAPADTAAMADAGGTFFYGSPRRPARMNMMQLLAGGAVGMVYCAPSDSLTIGRESNDVNFPDDPFISGHHATVTALANGKFRLADTGSKNGTYVRLQGESHLEHGDYLFLGQQLLRVEIT